MRATREEQRPHARAGRGAHALRQGAEAGGRRFLFDEKSTVDSFYVVLEGEVEDLTPRRRRGDPARDPRSRRVHRRARGAHREDLDPQGEGRFVPSRILEIDSETFRRVAVEVPDVADVFISGLARRMRYTQRAFRQQEKLAALGKLSAGLAHELNNPAAAARRASEELGGAVRRAQLDALGHDERFSPGEREALLALQRETGQRGTAPLDPLALGDAEDELAEWLTERGIEEPWDLTSALAAAGVDAGRLDALADELKTGRSRAGLAWLAGTIELVGLADEVATSAGRISELVGAMKDYTYMDRACRGRGGCGLGHREHADHPRPQAQGRLQCGGSTSKDLPKVQGRGGELNQVWTNLLDNAADAVDGRGNIIVRAYSEDGSRRRRGRGRRSWDTPRGAGATSSSPSTRPRRSVSGTGLGLDVVRRIVVAHGGEVYGSVGAGGDAVYGQVAGR